MKVLLTGATGQIGTSTLSLLLSTPQVTKIITLTRRPLSPALTSPKLTTITHHDFLAYPPSLMEQLKGVEACIWTLGGIPSKYPNLETARTVNVEYPFEAAKAIISNLCDGLKEEGKMFRFLYVSGHAVSRDLSRKYFLFEDAIHIKGEIEVRLDLLEQENIDSFRAYFPRVGSVIPPNSTLMTVLGVLSSPLYPTIKAGELAACMVDVAMNGHSTQIISHDEIQRKGKAFLARGL